MLRTLKEKANKMQEEMKDVSKELRTLIKNQRKCKNNKNPTVIEIEKTFDGFISRVHTVKERISEF